MHLKLVGRDEEKRRNQRHSDSAKCICTKHTGGRVRDPSDSSRRVQSPARKWPARFLFQFANVNSLDGRSNGQIDKARPIGRNNALAVAIVSRVRESSKLDEEKSPPAQCDTFCLAASSSSDWPPPLQAKSDTER